MLAFILSCRNSLHRSQYIALLPAHQIPLNKKTYKNTPQARIIRLLLYGLGGYRLFVRISGVFNAFILTKRANRGAMPKPISCSVFAHYL
jgi:hypothetical protein